MLLAKAQGQSADYRERAIMVAALLAPFVIYLSTVKSIISIWDSSGTFAHGYAVFPISLWLIWRRRDALSAEEMKPWWPGLLLLAGCGFAWLAADVAAVQVVRQYAFVAMIPVIVLTMAGPAFAKQVAFPLLFLLLAVPFGEVFIGPLVDFTADFTVAALKLTGIPVLRNGAHFDIPSGRWSVLEACSGVRYLISSVTLGCLYAYLTYRSLPRRILFILVSIAVPIVANGIRAYLIVMIADLSGMRLAVGIDHLIYGWLFFGLVMLVMFWIGSLWREDASTAQAFPVEKRHWIADDWNTPEKSGVFLLAVILCLCAWPLYSAHVKHATAGRDVDLARFDSGWKEARPFTEWKPHITTADESTRRFFREDGVPIGLQVFYYRDHESSAKLVSSSNVLVTEKDPTWMQVGATNRAEVVAGREIPLQEMRMRGQGAQGSQFLVWKFYNLHGTLVASDYIAKFLQAKNALLGQGDDGAAILLFAPYESNPEDARRAMRAFLAGNIGKLKTTLTGGRDG